MATDKSTSVAVNVVLNMVVVTTIVLALVSFVTFKYYSRQLLIELQQDAETQAEQLSSGVVLAVWNLDQVQIKKIMESAMLNQDVFAVIIHAGVKNYALVRSEEGVIQDAVGDDYKNRRNLNAKYELKFSGENIGNVELYITPEFVDKKISLVRNWSIMVILFLDAILIASLYLLLWRRVLFPLKRIESFAVSISNGERDDTIISQVKFQGEFSQLRKSFQLMMAKIDTQLIETQISNDRFWRMVHNFPIPLIIYTPASGEISFINQKFTKLFGYGQLELANAEQWFVLAYPDEIYRKKVIDEWMTEVEIANLEKGMVRENNYKVTCKDGSVRLVDISGVPSGEQMLVILNDVTDRIQAEDNIRNYQISLEETVATRTQELVAARDIAEKANRSKSVFLSNMSHELRTPLNAILGFARLLGYNNKLDEDGRKKVATINRAGEHLLSLINDVLEISRIEAGKTKLNAAPFALSSLLQGVEEIIHERATAKGLKFQQEFSINVEQAVIGDEHHLKQVLINLLGNAVKYTDQGIVMLKVYRENKEVYFEITDTGSGITEEDQKSIFLPFYQTESGIAKGDGTGLGLAISQEYTKMMGGQLTLKSLPGQGSVFTLKVPLVETGESVIRHNTDHVIGLQPGQQEQRILVVDDNADNRELVKQYLETAGFKVKTADDGQQAIDSFQQWKPHFIWMDMHMPILDGYQATQKIRMLPGGDQVKIVALTASAFEEDRKKIISAGCDDLVRKPFEEDRLFEVLAQFLGVRYQYETAGIKTTPAQNELDLSVLSSALLKELQKASNELDVKEVRKIITQIAESQPELAARLNEMAQGFHLDQISALCQDVDG